jgi:two-component system LytT family response regulator
MKKFGRFNQSIDVNGLQEIIRQFQAPKKATALPIKSGDRINLIRFENIAYLEAQDKYVCVFTIEGSEISN